MMDGSGALGRLGIVTTPIGTLDELREQGIDPREVACCHAPAPGVIRGCAIEKECPFHLKRYGGFKGTGGPKYVGYFLQTHEGNKKEDFCTCVVFVRTLLARQRAGMAARQEGKPHEIIRVVAQEGEKIITRISVPVNELDKSPTADYKYVMAAVEVPKFPRPGQNEKISYDQKLTARELARQRAEDKFEDELADTAARVTMDDNDQQPVVAEPVRPEVFMRAGVKSGKAG